MFDSDKALGPLLVALSSGIFSFLAWKLPRNSGSYQVGFRSGYEQNLSPAAKLYIGAAALLLMNVPYSLFCLEPINQKLEAKATEFEEVVYSKADEAEMKREDTTHYLVDRWAVVNLGRSVLSGAAAVLATLAAFTPPTLTDRYGRNFSTL
ncbi:uncharacterized protein LTR77_002550 [Saxophila tyrrhenica]|uniref:Uncharacterized protein n=1 Tax=Saxophila tyrrhenica TaxID=1690608 RepID=A0AAV9PJK7_9PEZI|nr:hypothetical protein LTR77_002550 [Saxophila tyrrhenica]